MTTNNLWGRAVAAQRLRCRSRCTPVGATPSPAPSPARRLPFLSVGDRRTACRCPHVGAAACRAIALPAPARRCRPDLPLSGGGGCCFRSPSRRGASARQAPSRAPAAAAARPLPRPRARYCGCASAAAAGRRRRVPVAARAPGVGAAAKAARPAAAGTRPPPGGAGHRRHEVGSVQFFSRPGPAHLKSSSICIIIPRDTAPFVLLYETRVDFPAAPCRSRGVFSTAAPRLRLPLDVSAVATNAICLYALGTCGRGHAGPSPGRLVFLSLYLYLSLPAGPTCRSTSSYGGY